MAKTNYSPDVHENNKHANGNLDGPLTVLFSHTFDCGSHADTWYEGIIDSLYNENLPIYQKLSKNNNNFCIRKNIR